MPYGTRTYYALGQEDMLLLFSCEHHSDMWL